MRRGALWSPRRTSTVQRRHKRFLDTGQVAAYFELSNGPTDRQRARTPLAGCAAATTGDGNRG